MAQPPTIDDLARLIAEHLPSPYALDTVWRQTSAGAVFDLSGADADSVEQWRNLARVVLEATLAKEL